MALYFETEAQSISFLVLCAVGFLIAVLFDGISFLIPDHMKAVADILLFLVGGFVFLLALFVMRGGELRAFHWLALLTGAILYALGIRRCLVFLFQKLRNRKKLRTSEEK